MSCLKNSFISVSCRNYHKYNILGYIVPSVPNKTIHRFLFIVLLESTMASRRFGCLGKYPRFKFFTNLKVSLQLIQVNCGLSRRNFSDKT